MKRVFLGALFFARLLLATENEPLTLEIGAGYGQEKVRWKSSTDTQPKIVNNQEHTKNISLLETLAVLRTIQYDFCFSIEGGYGYPFSVPMKEEIFFQGQNIFLQSKAKGYQAHAFFLFGYEADLTPDRFSHFFVAPLVGYAGFWKKFHGNDLVKEGTGSLMIEQQDHTLKQTWFGPCLGGGIFAEPDKQWRWEIMYLFDWQRLRHSSFLLFAYTTPLEQGEVTQREKEKKMKGFGHLARGRLIYRISSAWKSLFQADFHYFGVHNQFIVRRVKNEEKIPLEELIVTEARDRMDAAEWQLAFLLEISTHF